MNKDVKLLSEAYEQVYNEGVWDRLKARGAQAVGAVKGAGQAIKGGLQQVKSGVQYATGNTQAAATTRAAGQQNIQAAKGGAQTAKIDSILKSKTAAINKLATDIVDDLTKLGLNNPVAGGQGTPGRTAKTPQQMAAGMLQYLTNELNARRV